MATKKKTYEEQLQQTEQQLAGLQYHKSDRVLAAEQALADYTAQKPAEYTGSYQDRINGLMEQILDWGGLEYSFDADPLYRQYKDGYTRSAALAMQDTVAQAGSLTGGYGSSYAVSAGSQAYQEQLAKLDGVLPTLYGLALDRWNSENDALHARLEDLVGLEQGAREAYQQQMENYYTGLEFYTSAAEDAYSNDYKAYEARRAALADLRDYYADQQQQQVKNAQSEASHRLAVQKYEESVRQWEAQQAAAREKWQAQLAWEQQQFAQEMAAQASKTAAAAAKASASASGSSTSGSKTGSKTTAAKSSKTGNGAGRGDTTAPAADLSEDAKQLQAHLRQQAAIMATRVGGGMNPVQVNLVLLTQLQNHVAAGTVTRAEANRIGQQWGVTV